MPNKQPLSQIFSSQAPSRPSLDDIFSTTAPKPTPARDPLASVHGNGSSRTLLNDIGDAAQAGVNKVGEGLKQTDTALRGAESGKKFDPVGLLEGGLKTASGGASVVSSPVAPVFSEASKPIVDAGATAVQKIPGFDTFANSKAGDITQRATEDVADAANVMGTEAGVRGGGEKVPEVASAVKNASEGASSVIKNAVDTAKASSEKSKQITAEQNTAKAHNAIDTEIRNLGAKYPTVGKILNESETKRGTEPVKVLSSYASGKALPLIQKGKLQTDVPVKFLTDQVSRLAKIKSNLVASSKESIPVDTFKSLALKKIDKMNWSAAKKASETANVKKLIDSLEETYPEGIPNTEMDLLKSEHQSESSSYNSKSPFSPDSHAIVGQTAKGIVEKNGGKAPIEELNKLISSHYDAIKLLGSMRGKAPHGGMLSKMFNNTLGEVAGLAGGLAVGHPFLGAMVGRAGAEAVNEIINNHFISNPLKRTLIQRMDGVDPEVVQKANDYLNSRKTSEEPTESRSTKISSEDDTPAGEEKQDLSRQVRASESPDNGSTKKGLIRSAIDNAKNNGERGFIKNPLGPKIHDEDAATMRDFTDYASGEYSPSEKQAANLELDATRMWEKYFPDKKIPKSIQGIANEFGRALERGNYKIGT